MGRMSREKGKRGERYVADFFKDHGYDAHRSAQFNGKTGQAADVIGIDGVHIEVKFQERMTLYDWMSQAIRDSEAEGKGNLPIVIHKQSRKDMLVTMRAEDWILLYEVWNERNETCKE